MEEGFDTFTEKLGYTWDADLAFADVDPSQYVALVPPGGRAPEYIRHDTDCRRILARFLDEDKPMAHLCHASLLLTAAARLDGGRIACYPAIEPEVRGAGAEFVDGEAVVDGVMVSARAWPDHPAWMREFMKVLQAKAPVA